MFIPADKSVYEEYPKVTRHHKEQVLKIANNNLKLPELTGGHRGELDSLRTSPITN